jgi:hypothetical protein
MSLEECTKKCQDERWATEQKIIYAYMTSQISFETYQSTLAIIYEDYRRCVDQCAAVHEEPPAYIPPTPTPTPTPTNGAPAPSGCMIAYAFQKISPRLGVLLPPMRKFRDALLPAIAMRLYYRASAYILSNLPL